MIVSIAGNLPEPYPTTWYPGYLHKSCLCSAGLIAFWLYKSKIVTNLLQLIAALTYSLNVITIFNGKLIAHLHCLISVLLLSRYTKLLWSQQVQCTWLQESLLGSSLQSFPTSVKISSLYIRVFKTNPWDHSETVHVMHLVNGTISLHSKKIKYCDSVNFKNACYEQPTDSKPNQII